MIDLQFDISQLSSTDIEGVESSMLLDVISETCFFLPVRLMVNGEDIFQGKNIKTKEVRTRIELPAFGLLLNWKGTLKRLPNKGRERIFLADAGQMMLERDNKEVKITTSFNNVIVSTNYDEFYSSVAKSIDRLFKDLRDKFPDVFVLEELRILEASQ